MAEQKRLAEAIEDFTKVWGKKRARTTAKAYEYTLGSFLLHVGDKQMRYLTEVHVEDFFYGPRGLMSVHHTGTKLVREAVTEATHNNYRQRLQTFFRYCARKGWIKKDLMAEVEVLEHEKHKPRLRVKGFRMEEMLDAAKYPRDRAYIALAQNTLKRASEIIPLTISRLDLEGGWISVYNKKAKRWDQYPITTDLDREMRQWLTAYAEQIGRPLEPEDYVIPAMSGMLISHFETQPDGSRTAVRQPPKLNPRRTIDRGDEIVRRSLVVMGYSEAELKGAGSHTIRRSVARAVFDRLTADKGYASALRVVSAMLDHESQATTEIYLGLDEDKARRDELMRGQDFISAMKSDENVVPLRAVQ